MANVFEMLQSNPQATLVVMTAADLRELIEEITAPREEKATEQAEEYLTSKEVQSTFGISHTTIWRWKRCGLITPIRIGGLIRYRMSEILSIANNDKA